MEKNPLDIEQMKDFKDFTKEKVEIKLDDLEKFLKKYELHEIHSDFLEKLSLLLIAALGVVTAVAWDQVLKGVASSLFAGLSDGATKVTYAFMVTAITVLVSIIATKFFENRQRTKARRTIIDLLKRFLRLQKN